MNSIVRNCLLRRLFTLPATSPPSRLSVALCLHPRRFYASSVDDNPPAPSEKTNEPDENKEVKPEENKEKKSMLDVSEYYSQYIKEYEQGGFKDEEEAQWAVRQEKLPISRGRGETGVMDVDEAVEFLRAERIVDICTLRMPQSLAYAPYMVIGSPLSRRHMNAMTEKMLKAYKTKRAVYDPPSMLLKDIKNPEWRAFDLGNLVIHLMTPAARKRYDIEMLWAVGPEHDEQAHAVGQMDEYSDRLKKLQEDIDSLTNVGTQP